MANAEQKHKYFADQFDDETVLYVFHKHPVVMRYGLVFGMLGPLVGIIPTAIKPTLGFPAFFAVLAVVVAMAPTSPSRTKKAAIGGGLDNRSDKASRDDLSMDPAVARIEPSPPRRLPKRRHR